MVGVNIDTFASLSLAFTVNASLLIVAAAVFHASGHYDVSDLADAHRLNRSARRQSMGQHYLRRRAAGLRTERNGHGHARRAKR